MTFSFCRACGLPGAAAEPVCSQCGTSTALPGALLPASVGSVVSFRKGLHRRSGRVIDERDAEICVIVDDVLHTVPASKIVQVEPPPAAPIYWLYEYVKSHEQVDAAQMLALVLGAIAGRRALAQAALAAADRVTIRGVGLNDTETAWLLMWCDFNARMPLDAAQMLLSLPAAGYPDKACVALGIADRLVEHPEVAEAVAENLASFDSPTSKIARFALTDGRSEIPNAAPPTALPGVRIPRAAIEQFISEVMGRAGNALTDYAPTDMSTALDALRRGPATDEELLSAAVANACPVALLDDLIDAGFRVEPGTGEHSSYLRARQDPGSSSDEEIAAVDHHVEAARRRYLSGELTPGSAEPVARRFDLLARLREGEASVLSELMALLPAEEHPTALAVGASLRDGHPHLAALDDPTTWPVLASLAPSGAARAEAPFTLLRFAELADLERAKALLFDSAWSEAAETAHRCLQTSIDESIRDEALNTFAAAMLLLGDAQSAFDALVEAIAGADSPELIINFGIVGSEIDRERAALELARLASEAPTLDLRATAGLRAALLWRTHAQHFDDDDEEDEAQPPASLIAALRALVVAPISMDHHLEIGLLLSWADSEWLANPANTGRSPHADTPEHRLLIAKAAGLTATIAALQALIPQHRSNDWLIQQRDQFVFSLQQYLFSPYPGLGAAALGLELVDGPLLEDPEQADLLAALSIRALAANFCQNEDDGRTLKDEFLERAAQIRARAAARDDEQCERIAALAVELLIVGNFDGWVAQANVIADAARQVVRGIAGRPRRHIDEAGLARAVRPMIGGAVELQSTLRIARMAAADAELDEIESEVDNLFAFVAEARTTLTGLIRA